MELYQYIILASFGLACVALCMAYQRRFDQLKASHDRLHANLEALTVAITEDANALFIQIQEAEKRPKNHVRVWHLNGLRDQAVQHAGRINEARF